MNRKYLVFIFGITWCNIVTEAQRPELKTLRAPWAPWMKPSHKAKHIYSLLERLNEPISLRKGIDRATEFRIPSKYLAARYQMVDLIDRSAPASHVEEVDIKPINLPDIRFPSQLGWQEIFSMFLPVHREYAAHLVEILMGIDNIEDVISAMIFCRERINPHLFVYAVSVAMAHRHDTGNMALPSIAEIFPEKFMDRGIFQKARQEANVVPAGSRVPIEIPVDYTASNLEPEHRVAYFREDVGINLGHWFWHINYPFNGPPEVLSKDRVGELFYYFHQQIISRYNFERLCNNLGRVERLIDWHEPIKEGYFPKLENMLASRIWPSRQKNAKLRDIDREMNQLKIDIQELERWAERILEAIDHQAAFNENGVLAPFKEDTGIDVLGYMIQPNALTANQQYYGELHALGHVLIAYVHDPDGRNLEGVGVMGDTAVAMRDPIFYRWHKYIDDLFQEYKSTLRRYTVQELDFPGVKITSVDVVSKYAPVNEFTTFWQKSDIELYRGLDFAPHGSVLARITHLQHHPFVYRIEVDNSGPQRKGTVRIFMAPKFDERGLPMLFRDQKHLFIELDHFTVTMQPGSNKYERHSLESSVTFPLERTFANLNSSDAESEGFSYCGCGWPQHMLIPKGTIAGFPAELFVMMSDHRLDNVEQPPPEGCHQPHNYCGWRKRKYPDRRAMGYPFDRMPRSGVNSLEDFITTNMKVQNVRIKFNDEIIS